MSNTICQAIDNSKPMSRSEEQYVFKKYRETSDIKYRDLIVKANFRFVVQVASHMQSNNKNLQFDDMVSEGVLGMMHAIDTFDHTKGLKFITYAVYWIKYYIVKSGYYSSLVAVPSGKIKKIKKDLANNVDIEHASGLDMQSAYNALQFPVSLNTSYIDGEKNSLEDTIADTSVDVDKDISQEIASRKLVEIVKKNLSNVKADIILSTYGLGRSKTDATLKELAQIHGMSHERIRQLRKEANYELSQLQVMRELKEEFVL